MAIFDWIRDQCSNQVKWVRFFSCQALLALWRDKSAGLSPRNMTLTGIVLENGNFDTIDFSGANLRYGFLSHADFRNVSFRGAKLKSLFVADDVNLDSADFSGVTEFDDSRWGNFKWWLAKCIPTQMAEYLVKKSGHSLSGQEKLDLSRNCQ